MALAGNAGALQRGRGEAHHHLRPADHGDRALRIEGGARDQRRDDADIAAPVRRSHGRR